MRIFSRSTLRDFWSSPNRGDSQEALLAWFTVVRSADWRHSADVKASFGNASIIGNQRVVFNICGNKYRLIVGIRYETKNVYVKFVGTHREYDQVNAETVERRS
jgi:mRNA interferase HigB